MIKVNFISIKQRFTYLSLLIIYLNIFVSKVSNNFTKNEANKTLLYVIVFGFLSDHVSTHEGKRTNN